PAERYEAVFRDQVSGASDAAMAFGRLCIVPGDATFLREAILTSFHRDPAHPGPIPALTPFAFAEVTRAVYRGSIDSDYGKNLRWAAEKTLGEAFSGKYFSRNQLFHTGGEVLQDRSPDRTDILH